MGRPAMRRIIGFRFAKGGDVCWVDSLIIRLQNRRVIIAFVEETDTWILVFRRLDPPKEGRKRPALVQTPLTLSGEAMKAVMRGYVTINAILGGEIMSRMSDNVTVREMVDRAERGGLWFQFGHEWHTPAEILEKWRRILDIDWGVLGAFWTLADPESYIAEARKREHEATEARKAAELRVAEWRAERENEMKGKIDGQD